MSIAHKAAYAAIWNQAGKISNFILFFLTSLLVARRLGSEHYGIYSILLSIQTTVATVTALGLEQVLFRFIPQCRGDAAAEKKLVFIIVLIRAALMLLAGGILWSAAGLLAGYFDSPQLGRYLRLFIPFIIFSSATSILQSFLVSKMRTRMVTGFTVAGSFMQVGAIYLLVTLDGTGLRMLLYVLAVISALTLTAYSAYVRPAPARTAMPFPLPVLLDFGFSIWLIGIMNYLLGKHFSVMVMGHFSIPVEQIGYFSLATGFATTISTMLLMGTSELTLSIFSELHAAGRHENLAAAWSALVILGTVLVVPPGVFVVLRAGQVVSFLYGGSYMQAGPLLAWALVFLMAARLLGGGNNLTLLYALHRHKAVLLLRTVTGAVNAVATYLLIRFYGVTGAVIATGIATVLTIAVEWGFVSRHARVAFPVMTQFKITAAAAIGGACCMALEHFAVHLQLVLEGCVYSAIFISALWLVKPFDAKQLGIVKKINARLGRALWYFSRA